MASNCNDLSMPDDNKLCKVNQISEDEDEDEDEDGDYTVIEKQSALRITGSKNIYVFQNIGNDAEPNSTGGKDEVSHSKLIVEEIRKILRKTYSMLPFPTVPWLKNDELLLEEHFVQLELEDTNEIISLENIFIDKKKKQEINWIYIEAPPGFGKTTLACKLLTDWVANKKYVQKFEMAFLIILRHLQGKTVKTIVSEIVEQNDEEKVWKLINKKETLIIFDEWDGIGNEDKSKIAQLDFEGTVIITGRTGSYRFQMNPSKESKISSNQQKNIQFWNRRITITGIDESNRNEFLSRIFNQNSKWSEIKTLIYESKNRISDLYKSPLMLILLAYILSENLELNIDNITKTELYKNLINCLVIRSQSKIKENIDSSFDLFSDSISTNDEIIEIFIEFGVMALENLKDYNLQFEENETVEKIYPMGLLIKHETKRIFKTPKVHYEALHLSVMEFAVSLSLWLSYKKNDKFSIEQLNFIRHYIFDVGERSLVVPFLCGLMSEKVNELFDQLKPHCGLLIEGDFSFLLAECHKNDLLGEAISSFIPSLLKIEYKPSNELLQLIEYGVQFKKLKYILIDIEYLEHLPVDLSGVNVEVTIEYEISNKTIVEQKCKKIIFNFCKNVSENTLEFALNTFNRIDCKSKKIKIKVSILSNLVKVCLKNKWKISKLDELNIHILKEIRSEDIIAMEQFITLVIENCQVEKLELENKFFFMLEKIINLISKLSFLKSVFILGENEAAELNLIAKFRREMSLDLLSMERSLWREYNKQITIFPHLEKILCENESIMQNISKFFNKKVCNDKCSMTFNDECVKWIKILKSEIAQSSSGFDSVIQLGFDYSKIMKYKDKDVFLKNVTKCNRVQTITFHFSKINEIIDFTKEYQNVYDTIFSKVNLIIDIDLNYLLNKDSELEEVTKMMKIKRLKTLILYSTPKNIEKWCQSSFVSNLFQLIHSGEIDDLEIHINHENFLCFPRLRSSDDDKQFYFFPYFVDQELELVWENLDDGECSFKITRKY